MPKPADVMITTPLYQQHQQYEIAKFLKTKPLFLGILEILLALLALGLTIWIKCYFLLWSPIIYIIIGAVTVSAAHTLKPCLVKASQMIGYVNFAISAFSLFFHFILIFIIMDVSIYVLLACDILIFIFSLVIAISYCSCCCNPESTPVMVSCVTTHLPVMHMGQLYPSAVAQPVSSVMYMFPHGSVPSAPLPNYGPVPTASAPMYTPVQTTPPPNYDKLSDALPPNYSPVPSSPPPAYEYEDLQTRR
ncbi:uncharacterized protein LOC127175945 isoform X2 [Labeo rohita]|nr:uncharacterized protein LOC127175945 isoform X2 [Labeo rohita]XP_050983249.1 uncharacterized protein LOC127175945 isoform X2 [Labeo rohita]